MSTRLARILSRVVEASPLRHATFRSFYLGTIGTALGYTMQATVAAWLMATLTDSALLVALVQTASTLPTLLFGLAAGSLADIVDRRRILFVTQLMLLVSTVVLAGATLAHAIGPPALLALTFFIGAGFTFYMPAQQASINDLVVRGELARAVALGAVAFNVARAAGPALAGAIAAWLSSGSALLASAAFFCVMIVALRRWTSPKTVTPGIPETLFSGIESGLRYARHSPPMRALIVRNVTFSLCASALWALLPLIARDQLGLGAGGYGLLSASFGIGAVMGALSIPRQLQRMPLNTIVTAGALLWVVATFVVASTHIPAVALIGACGAGAAWVGVFASLSAGTQSAAPAWVRARAVSMGLIAVQASLAIGSAIWGTLATFFGTQIALAGSAVTLLVLLGLLRRVSVRLGDESEVTPSVRMIDMGIAVEPLPDDGPVLIQLEYRIDPENRSDFLRTIASVEPTRRRNGATSWAVFRDLSEEDKFFERFVISSWAEYVRLRTRMTIADRQVQDRVGELQRPDVPVRISRLIGIRPGDLPAHEPSPNTTES